MVTFGWGHMGWLVFENRDLTRLGMFGRYAKDVLRDPFYARLERKLLTIWLVLISWNMFFVGGVIAELFWGGNAIEALQFGLSLLIWGVFVRTVLVWHITWSVNSVTHLWGYRNYETDDSSRNNVIIGIVSNGEGWHNNHHADPRSAIARPLCGGRHLAHDPIACRGWLASDNRAVTTCPPNANSSFD